MNPQTVAAVDATLNLADQPNWMRVEAEKDGVRVRETDSPFGNDCIASIRPMIEPADIQVAIQRAHSRFGKAFDFDFDFTKSDRMVCTEVIYRSYEGVGDLQFSLTKQAGRQTLLPEDLLTMAMQANRFHVVAAYCHCQSGQLREGDSAVQILRDMVA